MHVAVFEKDKEITFPVLKSGPATDYGVHVGKWQACQKSLNRQLLVRKVRIGKFPWKKVAASENQPIMFPTAEVKPTVEASWLRETLRRWT